MVANKKYHNKKIVFITISTLLTCCMIILTLEKFQLINLYKKPVTLSDNIRPVNSVDYSTPDPMDNKDINAAKNDGTIDKQPGTKPITVTITRVYQDNVNTLHIRTLVEGQNTGVCKLEMSNDINEIYSKEVEISQQNNVFVCNGFDVPSQDIPASGEWTIKVTATGGGASNSASQIIKLLK
jgi:hypothetical protein